MISSSQIAFHIGRLSRLNQQELAQRQTGGSFGTTLRGSGIEFAPVIGIRQPLDTPDSGGQLSELAFAHRLSTTTAPDNPVAARPAAGGFARSARTCPSNSNMVRPTSKVMAAAVRPWSRRRSLAVDMITRRSSRLRAALTK